jgi:hypothetical protein
MYVTTSHSIGDTVYFCDEHGSTVTRAEVAEIRITQYRHAINTVYLVVFDDAEGERSEASKDGDDLHSSASAAFREWDSAHPEPAPEPATAEA